ncbi:hypothetical protein [Blastococcus sp. SYSU D00820]
MSPRFRAALPLVAATLLALAACTSAPAGFAPSSAADITPPTGSNPADVTVAPDGRVVTLSSDRDQARVSVVEDGEVTVAVTTPVPYWADTALLDGDDLLVGAQGTEPGYTLHVVDPGTGEVTAQRPVTPWPEGAAWATTGTVTDDGRLFVTAARQQHGPVLLEVDPATGAVLATAEPDLFDRLPGATTSTVEAVAASADGGHLVALVSVTDDAGDRQVLFLLRLGAGLQPLGEPVPLLAGEEYALLTGLAVDADGTSYTLDGRRLLAVAADATAATEAAELPEAQGTVVVRDGVAWLAGGSAPFVVLRLDLATGEQLSSAPLCSDEGWGAQGGVRVTADGVAVLGDCGQSQLLWTLPIDPEPVS